MKEGIDYGLDQEKKLVMSTQVIRIFNEHPIISTLYITDIGFFPKAKNHYVSRGTECESYILLLCVEGKGYFELNGEKYSLNKNQYCIIPKKTDHKYYADKKNPWSIYWLHFDGNLARQYFGLLQKDFFGDRLSLSQEEEAIVLIRLIYRLLEADYTLEKLIYVTNQFGILLSKLIYIVSDEKNTSTVDICMKYMHENISKKLQLSDLAQMTHFSRNYLILLFKEATGLTPIDYFIHMKIREANRRLDATDVSISEIAAYVGYDDAFYFSRVYKKVMGLSPTQYRKRQKG